jgi:hypothetical protein
MLGLGMLHLDRDRRLTAPNALDPFIVTKNPQRLGDCLVEAGGGHLDYVFTSAKTNAGNAACLQSHSSQVSYSLFIRYLGGRCSRLFFPTALPLFWFVFLFR